MTRPRRTICFRVYGLSHRQQPCSSRWRANSFRASRHAFRAALALPDWRALMRSLTAWPSFRSRRSLSSGKVCQPAELKHAEPYGPAATPTTQRGENLDTAGLRKTGKAERNNLRDASYEAPGPAAEPRCLQLCKLPGICGQFRKRSSRAGYVLAGRSAPLDCSDA